MCVRSQFATGCVMQIGLGVYEKIIFISKSIRLIKYTAIFVCFMFVTSEIDHKPVAAIGRLVRRIKVVIGCPHMTVSFTLSLYLLIDQKGSEGESKTPLGCNVSTEGNASHRPPLS